MRVDEGSAPAVDDGWNSGFSLYREATYVGAPRRPLVVASSANIRNDIQVVDWIVPDRVEVVSEGNRSGALTKFCLYMADRTTWIGQHEGELREIPANDIVIINADDPVRTISPEDTRHLTLILPRWIVARHFVEPSSLCDNRLNPPAQNAAVARGIMLALRSSIGLAQFPAVSSSLVGGLLDALAPCDTVASLPEHPSRDSRVMLVNQIIAANYADPDFSVNMIARRLKISMRYLHVICSDRGSPAKMIRQFRLRQAEALLKAPAWRDRSITDIAFACGFNSSSQFSTSFRAYAGCSPREFRYGRDC